MIISDSNYQDFTVYSDSKSCIQTINQYNNNHPIVLKIVEWLLRVSARHKNVTLCWVPSHCNIAGNEKADTEAKRVAQMSIFTMFISLIEIFSRQSSQRIRHDEVILTRLHIGHTPVTHSFLMENGNMPYCRDCLVPLSVLHILAECPTYDDERRRFFPNTVKNEYKWPNGVCVGRALYWYVRYREFKGIS